MASCLCNEKVCMLLAHVCYGIHICLYYFIHENTNVYVKQLCSFPKHAIDLKYYILVCSGRYVRNSTRLDQEECKQVLKCYHQRTL